MRAREASYALVGMVVLGGLAVLSGAGNVGAASPDPVIAAAGAVAQTQAVLPVADAAPVATIAPDVTGPAVARSRRRPEQVTVSGVFSPIWRGAYRARPGQVPWLAAQDRSGLHRT